MATPHDDHDDQDDRGDMTTERARLELELRRLQEKERTLRQRVMELRQTTPHDTRAASDIRANALLSMAESDLEMVQGAIADVRRDLGL